MTTRGAPAIHNVNTRQGRQPSKQAKKRVYDAFDADKLAHICTTWDFSGYADKVDLPEGRLGRERFYYYKNNGSDILAIAHLDSVQNDGTCAVVETSAGLLACSGTLDDRLGAYVILELLPKLGITCDWLLTTDEEIGQSTAEEFETNKDYNWMFQFDRGGTDVVMYEYETNELCDLVEESGARVGQGSFSDICMLDHLGISGFNWGVGYQDYHGPRSHAWLDDTFRMVARFVKFYNANVDKYLAFTCERPSGLELIDVDDAVWWKRNELVVVDCGHAVDLDDDSTFVEQEGGSVIVCNSCGTMPALDQTA